jgi:hypothetical protein
MGAVCGYTLPSTSITMVCKALLPRLTCPIGIVLSPDPTWPGDFEEKFASERATSSSEASERIVGDERRSMLITKEKYIEPTATILTFIGKWKRRR